MGRVIFTDADSNFQCDQTAIAYETLKCRRGFSPNFGVQTQQVMPSFGSEVPQYTSKTFSQVVDITGRSISAFLSFFQADNYGQLWVNNTLVYQGPWTAITYGANNRDLRHSYVTYDQVGDSEWPYYQHNLRQGNGALISPFSQTYSPCSHECLGIPLNNDISHAFREGHNTITLVCMNTYAIGPCRANITVSSVTVTGSAVQSTCGTLEARSR